MQQITDIDACRNAVQRVGRTDQRVGLVPTMGALHEGHLSLMREARRRCGFVAVTIFVNPTQFAAGEDLERYPRPLQADLAACEKTGVDLVFTPTAGAMFPGDATTTVRVTELTTGLCGAHRPGHFDGVTPVVAKLFQILPCDVAFFGEKDYQQLVVVRRMVRDLNMPIDIVGCPIVREEDGLALSSRNAYLSPEDRAQAVSLSRALFAAQEQVAAGECSARALVGRIRERIEAAGPVQIDYIEVVDPESLEPVREVLGDARICLAARIGPCRLIDNIAVRHAR